MIKGTENKLRTLSYQVENGPFGKLFLLLFFSIYLKMDFFSIILPNEAAESSSSLLLIISFINNKFISQISIS